MPLELTVLQVLDLERLSIPFYLNPESPFRRPILSHQAATHNIVLKVTVPKRTGRKRKKGSDGPFEGGEEVEASKSDAPAPAPASGPTPAPPKRGQNVCSKSRLDNPRVLRRKLQDNVDRYRVEVVGVVKGTHRFRCMKLLSSLPWLSMFTNPILALADYQWDMDQSPFIKRFREQVLSGDSTLGCPPLIDIPLYETNRGVDLADKNTLQSQRCGSSSFKRAPMSAPTSI